MTRDQLLSKLIQLRNDVQEKMGPVTDIWLPFPLMLQLDDRDIIERLWTPFRIGDTCVTHHTSSQDDHTIRVAFLMEFTTDEPTDSDGSTPISD